jgi:hypothetical protein
VAINGLSDPLELDPGTAERLLAGTVGPDDAPPGYQAVAGLLVAVRQPGTDRELAREAAAIEDFRSAHAVTGGGTVRSLGRRLAAPGIVAAVVLTGASMAAAAGVLPAPVQRVAHDALAPLGIDVPDGSSSHATPQGPATSSTPTTIGSSTTTAPPQVQGPAPSTASPSPAISGPTSSTPGSPTTPTTSAVGGQGNDAPGGGDDPGSNQGSGQNSNPGTGQNSNPGNGQNGNQSGKGQNGTPGSQSGKGQNGTPGSQSNAHGSSSSGPAKGNA